MSDSADRGPAERPGPAIRWATRFLAWLCWFAIAFATLIGVLHLLNAIPRDWIVQGNGGQQMTLIAIGVRFADEAAQAAAMPGLRADLLTRIVSLASTALFVWALYSARTCFVGLGRGEYFSRPVTLGLRNLSIAVLLYQTLAPVIEAIPRILYLNSIKGDQKIELSLSAGINESIGLVLIFAAVVALVSGVMAHAAKLAEENRQFV